MSSYPPLDVSAEIQQDPPDPNLFTAIVRNIDTSAPVNTLYGNLSSDAGGATIFQSDVSGLDSMQFPVDLTSYPPGFYTVFAITSDPAQTGEIVIYGGGAIPVPPIPSGRPTVQDVANLLRARTKDDFGNESGTFTDSTRPTAMAVDGHISAAMGLVCTRLPPLDEIDADLLPTVASVVAYRAALRVEKSYFPEQVRSDRSAYEWLREEYLDDLAALVEAATSGGVDEVASRDIGMIPVGSWTSIRYPPTGGAPYDDDPDLDLP